MTFWLLDLFRGKRTRPSSAGSLPVTLDRLTMITVACTLRTILLARLSMTEKQLQFHVILKLVVETTGILSLYVFVCFVFFLVE